MLSFHYVIKRFGLPLILCTLFMSTSGAHGMAIATQIEAVEGLLQRLVPDQAALFSLHIADSPQEGDTAFFEVHVDPSGTVNVQGTSGAKAA